ncbi:spore germination protein [Salipaludibacillus sp. CF4.18]|uniref:spore germination protein n=1 Tax=Salipaludibacillus sp. CF4.18 TaxID=3373081 RepID=UPI003EE69174
MKKIPDKQPISENRINKIIDDPNVISKTLSQNEKILKEIFADTYDFEVRLIERSTYSNLNISYVIGLTDTKKLDELVVRRALNDVFLESDDKIAQNHIYETVSSDIPDNWYDIMKGILNGDALIQFEGNAPRLLKLRETQTRSISEPTTEFQVFGPKIGFVEDADKNVVIIRNFIRDYNLHTMEASIGESRHMKINAVYLDSAVNDEVKNHIQQKMQEVENEDIYDLGELARFFQQGHLSLFPQSLLTERPDQAAARLRSGKVVIFFDHHTFCIITPIQLFESFSSNEDRSFTVKWNYSFVRLLRFVGVFIGTLLPALYVTLVAFHPELIPTKMAITIAQSRSQIPLDAPTEALVMLFALDVLVEASIRLPSFVGQTIGIVGGLVIGTAAVEAGLVSNIMVITIAFTAIAIFMVPYWEFVATWRLLRYLYVIAASLLGLYGMTLAVVWTILHLCKLNSLGHSYLSPVVPLQFKKLFHFFYPEK